MEQLSIPEKNELKREAAQRVLNYLHPGKENANTRKDICYFTGYNDRAVRECIELLRDEGELICNDQDGRGYYLAETLEEVESQYRRDRARALSILKRLRPFRLELKKEGRAVT